MITSLKETLRPGKGHKSFALPNNNSHKLYAELIIHQSSSLIMCQEYTIQFGHVSMPCFEAEQDGGILFDRKNSSERNSTHLSRAQLKVLGLELYKISGTKAECLPRKCMPQMAYRVMPRKLKCDLEQTIRQSIRTLQAAGI